MSQRDLKEAFVSNLTGTSLQEVALGSFLAPLCVVNRGLVWILYYQSRRALPFPFPWLSHLCLDFGVIVLPLVLSCTVLSHVLPQVIVGLASLSAAAMLCICHGAAAPSRGESFVRSHVQCGQVPFVTVFRVLVNMKTAISILAVDFSVFPRRYAKTETYGTGVMDFGVGAYVFANALVCPEARGKSIPGSRMSYVKKQLLSVWPLVVLGAGRLVGVKMAGYHEHVTEYGVHWNFFFTLAIVRVAASLLLALFPLNRSWLVALLIAGLYQFTLETSDLKTFLIHNSDRTKDFLHANKEGVFSVLGYIAVYMAGVQVGLYVMRPRTQVRDWLGVISKLFLGSCALYAALHLCQAAVEPVSRRMANLPFCIWTVAQSLFFMACLGTADVTLLWLKGKSRCHSVPSSWSPREEERRRPPEKTAADMEAHCLVQAVNRNQLAFFMLANLTTGLTNVLVDTFKCSDHVSVCIILSYMFVNCCSIHVLHLCGVTIKFW